MRDYSNYHNLNSNEKITHDGLLILERSLDGFSGRDIVINDLTNSKILVYEKWDSNSLTKKVIGKIEDIELGNIFTIENLNWLVTTFPEDNKIYRKAEIQLCNSTFPITTTTTDYYRDENGNLVYDDITGEVIPITTTTQIDLPCVVENKYRVSDKTEQMWLAENDITVILPYHAEIKMGNEFKMYDDIYKIINIDYTKVINDIGILTLRGEKEK